jgi:Cu2+-containing amine oxidase
MRYFRLFLLAIVCALITGIASAAEQPLIATQAAALAPLSAIEQGQCSEFATQRVFKDILDGDRLTVLNQRPVERRSGNGFLRTCNIELFDYSKNVALQATIDLATSKLVSSRTLKDVQPAAGQSEIAAARSFAESTAEARARLSPLLLRPQKQIDVTGLIRTDGKQCHTHRCVEIDYFETGPVAGTVPAAESTDAQVTWRPIKRIARAVVDLTNLSVLSMEVF